MSPRQPEPLSSSWFQHIRTFSHWLFTVQIQEFAGKFDHTNPFSEQSQSEGSDLTGSESTISQPVHSYNLNVCRQEELFFYT